MTQLESAKAGIITEEMKIVASDEMINVEELQQKIALGQVVIPKNIKRNFHPVGIGKGLSTKINANIGTSEDHCNLEEEIEKLEIAEKYGIDSVMDLSTGGRLDFARQTIIKKSHVMVGTVPIYGVITKLFSENKKIYDMTSDMLFKEIEKQAEQGVDFFTVHCGVNNRTLPFLENEDRLMGIVSRGGSLTKAWMKMHNAENPLYEEFDRLLEICRKYDITLSLGDGLRPGAQHDASDRAQMAELLVLGELVERSRNAGVQVMVEGPGHIPLDEIEMNVQLQKSICGEAPFYVLGPLVTDIAPGYDHIVGAIGGAIAAAKGVDFLCYLTPAEHLCLPNIEDVKNGVIATKIAAHTGDIVKGVKGVKLRNNQISKARRDFAWEDIYRYSIDPELARKRKENSEAKTEEYCTMCGKMCAVRTDTGKNL
jgi:phosphomethylpyrimidine synthase